MQRTPEQQRVIRFTVAVLLAAVVTGVVLVAVISLLAPPPLLTVLVGFGLLCLDLAAVGIVVYRSRSL